MISLLIITHETLGSAYTCLTKHFFPNINLDYIHILNVEPTENHEDIISRAQTLLPEINRGHGVLILTDIFGATPCNAAMKLVAPNQSAMISGLNAPMLVKAINYSQKYNDLNQFVEIVKQAGIDGILAFTQ